MVHQAIEDLNEVRRRRLDELFADEPYLSPTMKASRLHERCDVPSAPGFTHIAALRRDEACQIGDEDWLQSAIEADAPAPAPHWHPSTRPAAAEDAAPSEESLRVEIVLDTSVNPPRVRLVKAIPDSPEVLRLREAAQYLRVGVDRVREWVRSGALPCARIGRQYRFRRAALAAFLAGME